MVYGTGEDPSYAKPYCDLCDTRVQPGNDELAFRVTISDPFPETRSKQGLREHHGHICPDCNDVEEVLDGPPVDTIEFLRYHSVLDEGRRPQLLSLEVQSRHGSEWRLPPENLPARLRDIVADFFHNAPGIEFDLDEDDEVPESYW